MSPCTAYDRDGHELQPGDTVAMTEGGTQYIRKYVLSGEEGTVKAVTNTNRVTVHFPTSRTGDPVWDVGSRELQKVGVLSDVAKILLGGGA